MYDDQMHYVLCKLKEMRDELNRIPSAGDFKSKFPNIQIDRLFGSYDRALNAAGLVIKEIQIERRKPKILVFDIELKPMIVYVWNGGGEQYISNEQIIEDWSVLSWAAKWLGREEIFYQDVSEQNDLTNDEIILHGIWTLLNEADVVLTQNGKKFDEKKLNTRFEKHKMGRPSPFKHIDALVLKRKYFGLTSNKLEYSTDFFNEKYKKLKHSKFPGLQLWKECLKGNKEAWSEMREYNIHDVLSLEEEYVNTLMKWDTTINHGVYLGDTCCPSCGSTDIEEQEGKATFTKTAAYQLYQCKTCGAFCSGKENILGKSVKQGLMK